MTLRKTLKMETRAKLRCSKSNRRNRGSQYLPTRLRKSSHSIYTVGSEEELADATRTDIRLNAPQVSAPVPIELKIADKWTLAQLIERLENQLVRQYMRVSQYGIFLVVHNGKEVEMLARYSCQEIARLQ